MSYVDLVVYVYGFSSGGVFIKEIRVAEAFAAISFIVVFVGVIVGFIVLYKFWKSGIIVFKSLYVVYNV